MKQNYDAIVPLKLIHDKRLTANEKLLYIELNILSDAEGYTCASNKSLAKIFDVSPYSITRWLAKLESCGYISAIVSKEDGNARKIFVFNGYFRF